MVLFLSKIYSACHLDVNRIKPGSNSIMTDKHTAEHSITVCFGIYEGHPISSDNDLIKRKLLPEDVFQWFHMFFRI